jgi:ABC-type multidrug transport system ATPase subunit
VNFAFEHVTAGYRKGLRRRTALVDVNVELCGGEITALLGPNGAGKTTVLRVASGALRPWRGRVSRVGSGQGRGHPRIGHLPAVVELPRGQTLARFLRYGSFLAGLDPSAAEAAIRAAARDVRLLEALALPLDRFSTGMARRAGLAFVLLQRPPVLLLDEPWSGLDPGARHALRAVLRAEADRGTLVLLSSHELGEAAAAADRVLVLSRGRLVADRRRPFVAADLERVFLERAS